MKRDALRKRDAFSGYLLLLCTLLSLTMANIGYGNAYLAFWNSPILGHPLSHWINDGLMALFFLLVGLEIKREIFVGELRTPKRALLPVFAAVGGMLVPAAIYLALNFGQSTSAGFGIPMSTDIVFVVAILALLGVLAPPALKVFMLTLAVIDDIGAVLIIALFYSTGIDILYLSAAVLLFVVMLWLNKSRKVDAIWVYLLLGAVLWVLMMASGVHATLAGILTALAVPFRREAVTNPSEKLSRILHPLVYFVVLPSFVLSNTAVVLDGAMLRNLVQPHSLGIVAGLMIGKPLGIMLFSWLVLFVGWAEKPKNVTWRQLLGGACLGGIGFTMSVFIATLSFDDVVVVESAKIAVMLASAASAVVGCALLKSMNNEQ